MTPEDYLIARRDIDLRDSLQDFTFHRFGHLFVIHPNADFNHGHSIVVQKTAWDDNPLERSNITQMHGGPVFEFAQ